MSALVTQSDESYPDYFEITRLVRFSNWVRVRRAVAVCSQLNCPLREKRVQKTIEAQISKLVEDSAASYQPVEEIGQAEMEIISCSQHKHFKEEIKALSALQLHGEFVDRKRAKQHDFNLKKCT